MLEVRNLWGLKMDCGLFLRLERKLPHSALFWNFSLAENLESPSKIGPQSGIIISKSIAWAGVQSRMSL